MHDISVAYMMLSLGDCFTLHKYHSMSPSAAPCPNYSLFRQQLLCKSCCISVAVSHSCKLQLLTAPPGGRQASPNHMTLEGWTGGKPWVRCLSPPYEVVKMDNRSGVLFSECWLLCSFLLQVSTDPHDDAWGMAEWCVMASVLNYLSR